ncbi:methyltransferase domain-containing protein [Paenibacillus glacialis]|uniref:Methyltransferase type 11 n=1 Tax=Paenibacillus glacialis TaxID=494026 RepID=A0A168PFG2_9BACL|nr:methyltransferase domain-containing protein [Paenibacillus glacialis]OAB46709.1 hypothetical protein PGLA_00335 [Paenibacillus glacialis]
MSTPFERNAKSVDFFLPRAYEERLENQYCYDYYPVIWQPQVYQIASYLGSQFSCNSMIDIGCGTATKLVQWHPQFQIIGVDYGSNLDYCKHEYPFGQWIEQDLEQPSLIQLERSVLQSSVIVCADVIEHLKDPSSLLVNISQLMKHAKFCILSTPDRELVYGYQHTGPPTNTAHVREWSKSELKQLLEYFQLRVSFIDWTIDNEVDKHLSTIFAVISHIEYDWIAHDSKISNSITHIAKAKDK